MLTRLFLPFVLAVTLLISTIGPGHAQSPQPEVTRPQFVPGEVLVKLKPGVSPDRIAEVNARFNSERLRYFAFIGVHHLKLPANLSVEAAIEAIQRVPIVEYAVPNGLYYIDVTPNDPQYNEMWGLENTGQTGGTPDADIDMPEAWDITTGDSSVVVAVIDSGADLDHEDLAANLWTNPGEVPGNGIDDDGNGFVDDIHGWDFSSNDNDPDDTVAACQGHGTHTAGTIGAVGNNGVGVTGVNWNVRIMVLKAFRGLLGQCTASDAHLISAIEYATMMGAPISSNSWGGGRANIAMAEAILASRALFVAAAGNGGPDQVGDNNDNTPHYPSNYPIDNVIAVAATDHNDALAGFSNYGPTSVDLSAPGVNILSTLPNNTYGAYSGTSMATPHVAGVAALLLAQDPSLTVRELRWRILNGVDPIGIQVATGGRLNAANSLQYGLTTPDATVDISPVGSTEVPPGGTVSFQLSVTNNSANALAVGIRAYAQLDNGQEILVGKANTTINPGGTVAQSVSKPLPPSIPPGSTFRIFGQVETSGSFDEDFVEYTVVP